MSLDMYLANINSIDRSVDKKMIDTDKKLTFRLQEQEEEFIYKPDARQFTFYQICQFAINGQYSIRKLIYNEIGELINYKEAKLKKEKIKKFIKKCPSYKYSIYSVYNLDNVGFPNSDEILTANSQILNNF